MYDCSAPRGMAETVRRDEVSNSYIHGGRALDGFQESVSQDSEHSYADDAVPTRDYPGMGEGRFPL